MPYTAQEHTFVVCAYKQSPYLEECIQSLLKQTVRGNIIVSTATPSDFIRDVAARYGLPVVVNTGRSSIADDWNYGYMQCKTPLITLAHQDDVYAPEYLEKVLEAFNSCERPLIAFTDYWELRDGRLEKDNRLLRIKRLMLLPLRVRGFWGSRFVRRRVLSIGSPICCPSVCYCAPNLPKPVFVYGFRSDLDWQAWEKLSRLEGEFAYITAPLAYHRIHADSETSAMLHDNLRTKEDNAMFRKFWPAPIARLLTKMYASSEKNNDK